jgi:hypothetical protein
MLFSEIAKHNLFHVSYRAGICLLNFKMYFYVSFKLMCDTKKFKVGYYDHERDIRPTFIHFFKGNHAS